MKYISQVVCNSAAYGSNQLHLFLRTGSIASLISVSILASGQNQVINGDFSAGNSGFISFYNYIEPSVYSAPNNPSATIQNGDYTVNNVVPQSYFDWYPLTLTGVGNTPTGNFLIVNGADGSGGVSAGALFWTQTIAVAPNSTYTLSYLQAEISQIQAQSPGNTNADVEFSVNGTALTSSVVSDQQDKWEGFGNTWNSGSATTAVLTFTDLEPQGSGNDFAIANIDFNGPAPVPEPFTWGLGVGLVGLFFRRKAGRRP